MTPRLIPLALLLAACGTGDAAPGRPCDRLGLLCSDDRSAYPLHLADPRNASADLDGDGKLDLAVTIQQANRMSVLLGNGDGTFAPRIDHPVGTTPVALATADLDDDGRPDLAVANLGGASVSVLLNHCIP